MHCNIINIERKRVNDDDHNVRDAAKQEKKTNKMDVDVSEAAAHVEAMDAVDAALPIAPVGPVDASPESNPVCGLAIAGPVTNLREFNDAIVRKVLLMGDAANGATISVNCSTGVVEVEFTSTYPGFKLRIAVRARLGTAPGRA
ncbi:hypothetical protein HDU98_007389 [Podochytrium sp. JEL0797]|nr:hypothetical protein HDU98_007389 [Podochytrium sp. JEL0797]